MEILKSAQKVVFVLMAMATIAALFMSLVTGEQFLALVTMVFAFYFATPSTPSQSDSFGSQK